jgi:signal transduction histidine kinase
VFETFFTTKAVGSGTGLGLFLSHQIVESLGGDITVKSRPGVGTAVRVWLPLLNGDADHE